MLRMYITKQNESTEMICSTIKNYNDKEKQINMPERTEVTGETTMTRMTRVTGRTGITRMQTRVTGMTAMTGLRLR